MLPIIQTNNLIEWFYNVDFVNKLHLTTSAVVIIFLCSVLYICLHVIHDENFTEKMKTIVWGVIFSCTGFICHRLYWFTERFLIDIDVIQPSQNSFDAYGWATFTFLLIAAYGHLMMVSPVLREYVGEKIHHYGLAYMFILFWGIFSTLIILFG